MKTMSAWRRPLQSPAHLLLFTLAGLCVLTVAVIGVIAWRNLRQLDLISASLENTIQIQRVSVRFQKMLVAYFTDVSSIDADTLDGPPQCPAPSSRSGDGRPALADRSAALPLNRSERRGDGCGGGAQRAGRRG
jgi:hypothetical protein